MLSQADNELLTRVGPGTPGVKLNVAVQDALGDLVAELQQQLAARA